MMIDRSIQSKYIEVNAQRRIVAISDIHANLKVFKKLLKKIAYDPLHDELFLVGDLLEKGTQNMETLAFIMELSQNKHVHPLMGNCDFVCKNILHEYRLDYLKEILLSRKNSILHEMCKHLDIYIDEHSDMYEIAKILKQHYINELTFIDSLPHVIETQSYIFAHAGIINEENFGNEMRDIMTYDQFYKHAGSFEKYIVVGHLPVSEYCHHVCSFNPLIDHAKHIICIDGGNAVKAVGQLNALLIQNGKITFAHSDSLPKKTVQKDYVATNNHSLFITWHEREIKILKKEKKKSLCRHLSSGKNLWIPNSFIYKDHNQYHAENYTTHTISVKKGEQIKLILQDDSYSLIKKHGIMGWIPTDTLTS